MKRFTVAALFLSASAFSVSGADLVIYESPELVAPTMVGFDWSGPYVGIHGGYGWASATATDNTGGIFDEGVGETFSTSASGYLLGLQAGYNWQMDAFVFGIEADLGGMNVSGSNYVLPDPDNFAELGISGYADLTARLGFAIDKLLIYAKGGVAVANVYSRFGDIVDATGLVDPTSDASAQSFRAGWTVGAGVEYAFDETWSVKGEYQYLDFGSHTLTDIEGDTATVRVTNHVAKIGLNYSF